MLEAERLGSKEELVANCWLAMLESLFAMPVDWIPLVFDFDLPIQESEVVPPVSRP